MSGWLGDSLMVFSLMFHIASVQPSLAGRILCKKAECQYKELYKLDKESQQREKRVGESAPDSDNDILCLAVNFLNMERAA